MTTARWAFVRERRAGSGFPWLTLRDRPDMVRYRSRFGDPERPNVSPVVVTTARPGRVAVGDPVVVAAVAGPLVPTV